MSVLSLELIKQHLNIPSDYTGDDQLLEQERDSAEAYAVAFLDLEDDEEAASEMLVKPQVQQAMLMLIATLYNSRESEVYSGTQEMKAFDRLLYQYKKWSI